MLILTLPAFMLIPGYCLEFGGTNFVITTKNTSPQNVVVISLVPVHDPLQDTIWFHLNPDTKIDLNIPLM